MGLWCADSAASEPDGQHVCDTGETCSWTDCKCGYCDTDGLNECEASCGRCGTSPAFGRFGGTLKGPSDSPIKLNMDRCKDSVDSIDVLDSKGKTLSVTSLGGVNACTDLDCPISGLKLGLCPACAGAFMYGQVCLGTSGLAIEIGLKATVIGIP